MQRDPFVISDFVIRISFGDSDFVIRHSSNLPLPLPFTGFGTIPRDDWQWYFAYGSNLNSRAVANGADTMGTAPPP